MKSYPSISTQVDLSQSYFIFDKLDDSDIRAEWSPKRGFYKFGSRAQLLTPDQKPLWPVVARIQAMEASLGSALSKLRTERAVCFFEWHGPNSFAGRHVDAENLMRASLLDIAVYKKGLLLPQQVLDVASSVGLHTPTLLHQGRIDQDFLDRVRAGALLGVSLEGIIGKGPFDRASGGPIMFKHKTQAWFDRLDQMCAGDTAMFDRLK
jgi:hypothetical protein